MRKMKKFFGVLILFCFFILIIFIYQGIYFPESFKQEREKLFLIERGENLFQIAENLEKEGLIKNKFLFDLYIFIKGAQRKLQAGEYFLSPSESINRIAEKIISGDITKIVVTIPEGFTVRQIEEKMGLKLPGEDLEGFLFPDTYQFPLRVSGEEVVKKMRDNFDKKLAPYRNEISGAGLTISEIVTMASLLEKEVKTKEDKEIVSGILWKRLENNISLQVDATITYILRYKTTNPEGVAPRPYGARISKEDLQIDSPYNTYKYQGLPLGPICNPGLDSILAAIYPESSEFWYYLSPWVAELRSSPASLRSAEDEGTIFSETLEKHNIAKEKYLR